MKYHTIALDAQRHETAKPHSNERRRRVETQNAGSREDEGADACQSERETLSSPTVPKINMDTHKSEDR